MKFYHIRDNSQDAPSGEGIQPDKDGNTEEAYEILERPSPTASAQDSVHPYRPVQPIEAQQSKTPQDHLPTLQLGSLSINQHTEYRRGPLFSPIHDAFNHQNCTQECYSTWDEYPNFEADFGYTHGYHLRPDHSFQSVRGIIMQSALEEIRDWMTTARYIVPPDHTPALRKWARATAWQRGPGYVTDIVDEDEAVVLSCTGGYLHWACPYYVSDPANHLDCLLRHDSHSIEDVISHLLQYHLEPPYCPRCRQTFFSATDRDRHFYANVCEFRSEPEVSGITPLQKMQLEDQDDVRLDEKTRWQRVWATIFPCERLCRSPYLESPTERTVSMIRDFWATHGMRIISEHLTSHGITIEDDRHGMDALVAAHSSILVDLLTKVIGEQNST